MARMTKSFLTTLVLAIFLLLLVDSFSNAIFASDRLELKPHDLHTPENLWRRVELENSPPHLLLTPPAVLKFDESSIEKMLSPDCQIFDRSKSTEARLQKKLSLLRNRQQIESALNFATPSEIFESNSPGASLHGMPALLTQIDWQASSELLRQVILQSQQQSERVIQGLKISLVLPPSIDTWSGDFHAFANWTGISGHSKSADWVATRDQALLPLPRSGGILIGSLKVARHHRIEDSNTIVFQVPAGPAPLKGLSQRQIKLIRQSISAQCDQYWQYYEDCDYWRVQFTNNPEPISANQVSVAIEASEQKSEIVDAGKGWSPSLLHNMELDNLLEDVVSDAVAAWMAPMIDLELSVDQLIENAKELEFRLIESVIR